MLGPLHRAGHSGEQGHCTVWSRGTAQCGAGERCSVEGEWRCSAVWRVSGGGGTQQDPLTAATLHHGGGTILGEQTYHASWLKVNMLGVGLTLKP